MRDPTEQVYRHVWNLAAFVVVIAGMRAASGLLVSLLLAVFLTVLFSTPLRWMTKYRVPKIVGVLVIVAVLLAAGFLFGALAGTTLVELAGSEAQIDELFSAQIARLEATLTSELARFGIQGPQLAEGQLVSVAAMLGFLRDLVENLGLLLANAGLIILTMVFMLLEMSDIPDKVRRAFGEADADEWRERFREVGAAVRRYVLVKTVISLATGLSVWGLTAALGIEFPLLWGVVAFLFNYVPNIGSVIAAIPAVTLAWLQLDAGTAVATAAGYLAVNIFWANLVEPRVMGYTVGLSALVVFCSLVFWGWVLGPVGMLLSVPLTVMLRIVLATNPSTLPIAILLGPQRVEDLPQAPED